MTILKVVLKIFKGFCLFFCCFIVMHIIASSFYEVDPDGYLQAPDSYALVLLSISGIITSLSFKRPRKLLGRIGKTEPGFEPEKEKSAQDLHQMCSITGEQDSSQATLTGIAENTLPVVIEGAIAERQDSSLEPKQTNTSSAMEKVSFLLGMVLLIFVALFSFIIAIMGSIEKTIGIAVCGAVMLVLAITAMVCLEKKDPFKELRRQNRVKQRLFKQDFSHITLLETGEIKIPDVIEVTDVEDRAAMVFFETGQASVSMLQRRLRLGYATAARIVDRLEEVGVIGPFASKAPRLILMSQAVYESRKRIVPISEHSPQYPIEIDHISNDFFEYGGIEAELLSIDLMEGHEFEYWCADLLRELGFAEVEVTPGSGDQGVDILAKKDGINYAVQCKCYASELGNKPVQEVHAGRAIYHCQVGAVMTNRHFTAGGRQLAEATGVLLWDRDWIIRALKATKPEYVVHDSEADI